MNIVLPVSRAGLPLFEGLIKTFVYFGGLQRHSIICVPAPSVQQEAAMLVGQLRSVCDRVTVQPLPREPKGGWPVAPNMHFRDTVEILDQMEIKDPWWWFEEDGRPIAAGWADRTELMYHRGGRACMGVMRKAMEVLRKDGQPWDDGEYMVGFGIYPPNFKDLSTLYKVTGELQLGNKNYSPMPFDVKIRWEVSPHALRTDLIDHRGSTWNYQVKEDGRLWCEDKDLPEGIASYASTPIHEMAFVVHGCKDDSLTELVLNGFRKSENAQTRLSPGLSPVETLERKLSAPVLEEDPDEIFTRLCDSLSIPAIQRAEKWNLLTRPSAPPAAADPAPEATTKPEKQVDNEEAEKQRQSIKEQNAEIERELAEEEAKKTKAAGNQPILDRLLKIVHNATEPMDLPTLAADLGVNQQVLKDVIALPESGLELNKRFVQAKTAVPV
jgi:hypothetical protein